MIEQNSQNIKNKQQNIQQTDWGYFQRQNTFSLECGMHSINNLLRKTTYNKQKMVQICNELSDDFINPHKHILGGDYDANVLMIALQRQGYSCKWIDKRKAFNLQQYIKQTKGKQFLFFLINIQMPLKFYHKLLKFSSRHWYVIRQRKQGNQWRYQICDSNQERPKAIHRKQDLQKHLKNLVKTDSEILWVYKTKIDNNQSLQNNNNNKNV